ncbi:MAG: PKD domain-containing protein [Methanothrix sp.]|nr:PKD domain-containing protein [Methanothrix sp.]
MVMTKGRIFNRSEGKIIKNYIVNILLLAIIFTCFSAIATMNGTCIEDKLINISRPETPDGPLHTNLLINLNPQTLALGAPTTTLSNVKILIVTSGHGPLTGISPQAEKDYWQSILQKMGYTNINWFDGVPSFDLLNQHDLVIYDAGGYWYPLSSEVEPLWNYHFTGKPLIIIAPDINYDWNNIKGTTKPTFCESVAHIKGVLGIMPEVDFEVIANTGHEIVTSVPTNVKIPIPAQTSYPDCFEPENGGVGVLTQGYISKTEWGKGSSSGLPSNAAYDPQGSLFSVVAYPGSESEGRTVLFGFPPTAITSSEILDKFAEGTINFALGNNKPNLKLNAYIEDAFSPEGVPPIVNKAPGDKIDIVAAITPNEDLNKVTLAITAPSELGSPEKVFTKEKFSSQDVNYLPNPGLSVELTNLKANKDLQVVWRFNIANNANQGEKTISIAAYVIGKNIPVSKTASFRVVNNIGAIIITNRHLLYDPIKYHETDVNDLLTNLYDVAAGKDSQVACIVYYVDHYDPTLENWNQVISDSDYNSGEAAVNVVANKIRDLTKGWLNKLAPNTVDNPYPYIVIVGGDDVIPFYRTFSEYANDEKDAYSSYPTQPFATINHNYFLTDTPYADVKNNDWGDGKVEAAIGRITGASAKDMEVFMQNAIIGPQSSSNMVVVSDHRNEGSLIAATGEIAGANILNDIEQPKTIMDDAIDKSGIVKDTDVENAMNKGFELMWHASHGSYDKLYFNSYDLSAKYFLDTSEINSNAFVKDINIYHPFISTAGCHSGLLGAYLSPQTSSTYGATDNLVWAFVNRGISGYLGSSAYVYCAPGGTLGTLFYNALLLEHVTIGNAFKDILVNFDPNSATEQKTVRQFILYGLPWMSVNLPQNNQKQLFNSASVQNQTVIRSIKSSSTNASNTYSGTIDIDITGWTFDTVESFEVPVLSGNFDGVKYTDNKYEPSIPYIKKEIYLPLGCTVSNVDVTLSTQTALGKHNVPSNLNDPQSSKIYTSKTAVSGSYPLWASNYKTNFIDGRNILNIYISPLKFNIDTKDVTLYKQVHIFITYQTTNTAVMQETLSAEPEYTTGQTITTTQTIGNIGTSVLTGLQLNLNAKDIYGNTVASTSSQTFNVAPGSSTSLNLALAQSLPQGAYTIETNLVQGSNILGTMHENVLISKGEITDFSAPAKVEPGKDTYFDITFKNNKPSPVQASGHVYIYDPHNMEIADLPSLPITVNSGSEGQIEIAWNTAGKELGHYKAAAFVSTDGESFGPEYCEFDIQVIVNKPPTAPSKPSGSAKCVAGSSYSYSTSAKDPDKDNVKYTFDWGDGTKSETGLVKSGTKSSAMHAWSTAGTYLVKAMATDSKGATSGYSSSLTVTVNPNKPPNAPGKPSGSAKGYVGSSYSYSTSAKDPDKDNVKYTFDWGDGTKSETGLVKSGIKSSATHSWSTTGTYLVKANAMDFKGDVSGYSGSLSVTISPNSIPGTPSVPTGTVTGKIKKSYSYTTSATDPDGDKLKYTFNWGDGKTSVTHLVKSGTSASSPHAWSKAGTYQVKVMATDSKGAPSISWSSQVAVTIT